MKMKNETGAAASAAASRATTAKAVVKPGAAAEAAAPAAAASVLISCSSSFIICIFHFDFDYAMCVFVQWAVDFDLVQWTWNTPLHLQSLWEYKR